MLLLVVKVVVTKKTSVIVKMSEPLLKAYFIILKKILRKNTCLSIFKIEEK